MSPRFQWAESICARGDIFPRNEWSKNYHGWIFAIKFAQFSLLPLLCPIWTSQRMEQCFSTCGSVFSKTLDYVRTHHMFSRILNFLFSIGFLSIQITVILAFHNLFWFLCVDHVIWKSRRMLKLVLNIQLFLLLYFFHVVLKCILGHLQELEKVGWFNYKTCRAICPSFQSSKKQKRK